MKDTEKDKLIENFKQNTTEEAQKLVVKDAKLQFKALIFLQHKTCRKCRYKILTTVRSGKTFNPKDLCTRCTEMYLKEVRN